MTGMAPEDFSVEHLAKVPSNRQSSRAALSLRPKRGNPRLPKVALVSPPIFPNAANASAYAHLIGAPGTDSLPPAYPHLLGFPLVMALMTRRDFPLPALGMVHIANRIRQASPSRYGTPMTFTTWAANLRPHPRGTLVDIHLTAASTDYWAWQGVSTYLAKGVIIPGQQESAFPEWNHNQLDINGIHSWKLPAEVGAQYAAISGDANPIHTSRIAARLFGFKRPIAHGMYTAARAVASLHSPGDGSLDWTVRFGKPLYLPGRAQLEFESTESSTDFAVVQRSIDSEQPRIFLAGSIRPLSG